MESTSIAWLLNEKDIYKKNTNLEPFFISSWDISKEHILFPNSVIEEALKKSKEYHEKYIFWDEVERQKNSIIDFFNALFYTELKKQNLIIGSNGTSSIFSSINALILTGVTNFLVVTPVYFSTLEVLKLSKCNIFYHHLAESNSFQIDFECISSKIKKYNIQAIIITDPVFSIGKEIDIQAYDKLIDLCNYSDVWIVVDYLYGGMGWDSQINRILNTQKVKNITRANKYIFIESISKRLFINGIKNALIFASQDIVPIIERISVYTIGSFSSIQISLLEEVYSNKNYLYISSVIYQNIERISENYRLLQSLLLGSNLVLSECNTSYFCKIGIPKHNFPKCDDAEIACSLLHQTGILTIPLSRYLLNSEKYYNFRVNLALEKEKLLQAVLLCIRLNE